MPVAENWPLSPFLEHGERVDPRDRLIINDYRLRDNASGIDAIERLRTAADRLREAQESGFLLLHKPVPNHRLRASIAHLIDAGDKAVA